MRKKILTMSIVAVLTAVTSSSVIAFDAVGTPTTTDGTIISQVSAQPAAYLGNLLPLSTGQLTPTPFKLQPKDASVGLRIASEWITTNVNDVDEVVDPNNQAINVEKNIYKWEHYSSVARGDALIFPFFTQKNDWGTEFVARNTTKYHAIVAKAEVYSSDDSTAVLDFNVYLSGADVVRFKIENGKLTSEDGSIVRSVPSPSSNLNDIGDSDFASKAMPFVRDVVYPPGHAKAGQVVLNGYVILYGMAQAKGDTDDLDSQDSRYHNQHARLFANYRRELDVCRPGWRRGNRNAMLHGTYINQTIISSSATGNPTFSGVPNYSIAAPNLNENCRTDELIKAGNFFGDVGQHLSGTVRLYNGTNAPRDMILPAKAMRNFTWKNKIIWTEGEIASLKDRRITGLVRDADGNQTNTAWAVYNERGIREDALAFGVVNTAYTFNERSVANQLIITQPYKRSLIQLGNDDGYWRSVDINAGTGIFSFIYNVFNEHEKMSNIDYRHSPYDSTIKVKENEVEIMANLEDNTEFENENGFALLRFVDVEGRNARMPAIITQMIGSTVAGVPQVNWIYAPSDLFTDKDCPNPSSDAAIEPWRNELNCNY